MADVITVQVPAAFADEIPSDKFPEFEALRGGGGGAEAVLAVVSTAVGIAADATTVLMAKDAIGDFIGHLRFWIARRAGADPGSELIIEVSVRSADGESRIRLVSKRNGGAVPEVDMREIERLLYSSFPDHRARH